LELLFVNLSIRPLAASVRPDLRRAGFAAFVAIALLTVLATFGAPHSHRLTVRLVAFGGTAVFALVGAIAVRSAANEFARVVGVRAGPGTASNVRLGVTVLGYLVVTVSTLGLLQVPIQRLLLSGAITGVVIGIAAQQALANLFAGLVLLSSRPFDVGQWIVLRSGALGGEYQGEVVSIGLTYTVLLTEEGRFSLPNGGVLAAASGPRQRPERRSDLQLGRAAR
jgi:small-conductance mechanosensitive channel